MTTWQQVHEEMNAAVGFVEGPHNKNPWGEEQGAGDAAYCCSFACMVPYHQGYRFWHECQFGEKGDAYVPFRMKHAQDHGEFQFDHESSGLPADVQSGDQLIYDWNLNGTGDHIETCIGLTPEGYTQNIGANTGSPEGVHFVTRTRKYLLGRIRLAYSSAPSPGPGPGPTPPAQKDFRSKIMEKPILKTGSHGQDVLIMQALLMVHARDLTGNDASKWVDGNFGPHTQDVLKQWQDRTHSLTADGVCGPNTWAWLCGV